MGALTIEYSVMGHPFRVHHTTFSSGGALSAYRPVMERRRLQRLNMLGVMSILLPFFRGTRIFSYLTPYSAPLPIAFAHAV